MKIGATGLETTSVADIGGTAGGGGGGGGGSGSGGFSGGSGADGVSLSSTDGSAVAISRGGRKCAFKYFGTE